MVQSGLALEVMEMQFTLILVSTFCPFFNLVNYMLNFLKGKINGLKCPPEFKVKVADKLHAFVKLVPFGGFDSFRCMWNF